MLDKNDKKEIKSIVTEVVGSALEQIVLPEMQKIRDDISEVKDDISDLQATDNSIETLDKSEIKYVDDLSGRVLKLETKKA